MCNQSLGTLISSAAFAVAGAIALCRATDKVPRSAIDAAGEAVLSQGRGHSRDAAGRAVGFVTDARVRHQRDGKCNARLSRRGIASAEPGATETRPHDACMGERTCACTLKDTNHRRARTHARTHARKQARTLKYKGTRAVQTSSEDDRGRLELRLAKARAELQVLHLHSHLEYCRAPVRCGKSIPSTAGATGVLERQVVTVCVDQVKDAKLHSSTEQIEVRLGVETNCCGRLSVLVR